MERNRPRLGRRSRVARRGASRQMHSRGCRRAAPFAHPHTDDLERRVHARAANRKSETRRRAHRGTLRRSEPQARHRPAAILARFRRHGSGAARHERSVWPVLQREHGRTVRAGRVRRRRAAEGPFRVRRSVALRPRQPALAGGFAGYRARAVFGAHRQIESI